jgi:hypothetical protein
VCFESATGNVGFTTIITEPVTIYQPTRLSYDQLGEPVLKIVDNYTTIQQKPSRKTTGQAGLLKQFPDWRAEVVP